MEALGNASPLRVLKTTALPLRMLLLVVVHPDFVDDEVGGKAADVPASACLLVDGGSLRRRVLRNFAKKKLSE